MLSNSKLVNNNFFIVVVVLIMHNECRLTGNSYAVACEVGEPFFVNTAVVADDGVVTVGDVDALLLAMAIEHYNDVAPIVSSGIVF